MFLVGRRATNNLSRIPVVKRHFGLTLLPFILPFALMSPAAHSEDDVTSLRATLDLAISAIRAKDCQKWTQLQLKSLTWTSDQRQAAFRECTTSFGAASEEHINRVLMMLRYARTAVPEFNQAHAVARFDLRGAGLLSEELVFVKIDGRWYAKE